jgi:hypothetical protein
MAAMADCCTNNLGAAACTDKKAVMYWNLSSEASKLYTDSNTNAGKADVQNGNSPQSDQLCQWIALNGGVSEDECFLV